MAAPAALFPLTAHAGFIGGAWVTTGSEPGAVDVVNPADGRVIASLPNMGRDATEAAVRAARAAFPAWAARSAADRGAVLRRLHDLMGQNVDGEIAHEVPCWPLQCVRRPPVMTGLANPRSVRCVASHSYSRRTGRAPHAGEREAVRGG